MIIKYLVLLICVGLCRGKILKMIDNVTDEEYNRMPELFHLDEYDKCISSKNTLYCYGTIQLSPTNVKNPSEVWNIIEEVISTPKNYRHDLIRHGICVPESCPDIARKYYSVENGSEELRDGIGKCYSKKYKHIGLKAEVVKISCQNENPIYEIDNVDILYAFIVLSIFGVLIFSSIVEGFARYLSPEKYEQITEGSLFGQILTSFSLPKNLDRLRSEVTSSDGVALAPIQGVRVYNMYFVILCHTSMTVLMSPVLNPKYNENNVTRPETMIISNGGLICETNIVIANWLIAYYFFVAFEKTEFKLRHLVLAVINRFLRLVPIMLLVAGFNATWARHLNRGPIWITAMGTEYENCRNNWILNMFFLNNYFNSSDMCLQQTWYTAADMQVFVASLFILMYVMKHKENANKIFVSLIAVGMLITFVQHYYFNHDILLRAWPEAVYASMMQSPEWLRMYIPGHHHLSSCVLGLACGYNFYKYRTEKRQFITSKAGLLLWTIYVWVGSLGTILIGGLFNFDGYEQTRFGAAFYQAICRMSFSLPIAICIFGFTMGIGGPMRSVCNWAPLQYLGRLSLSAYLVHTVPMRIKAGSARTPVYASDAKLLQDNLGDFFIGYILAAIVCLCFEMPITALQKIVLPPFIEPKKVKKN